VKKWKLEELVEDLNYENDMLAGKIEKLEKRNKYLEWYSEVCETFLTLEKANNCSSGITYSYGNSRYCITFLGFDL